MSGSSLVFAALLTFQQVAPPEGPEGSVWRARRAVEGDSVAAVEARWNALLEDSPGDRAARLGLANLDFYRYDGPSAEKRLREIVTEMGDQPEAYGVRARITLSEVLRMRGDLEGSERLFARAASEAETIADSNSRARALIGLALARARTAGWPVADSLLEAAGEFAAAGGPSARALLHTARASVLLVAQPERAEAAADSAASFARRAREPRFEAVSLIVKSRLLMNRGLTVPALELHGEAIELMRAARDRFALAGALQWSGWYNSTIGAYGEARAQLYEAVAEAEASGNTSVSAWAALNLAQLSLHLRDVATAVAYATDAERLMSALGDRTGALMVADVQGGLASAVGDREGARVAWTKAMRGFEEAGNALGVLGDRMALTQLALDDGDLDEAEREIAIARSIVDERGMVGWANGLDSWEARLAIQRGDLESAEAILQRLLETPHQPTRFYALRARLAQIHVLRGDLARAESTFTEAADRLDAWRDEIDDAELRLHVFQLGEVDTGAATVISGLAHGDRVESAFHLAERRRARDLADRMVRQDAVTPNRGGAGAREARSRPAASVSRVMSALPENTALLHYVTGPAEPTTAFVVSRSGVRAYTLTPIDQLRAEIGRLVALVESTGDARGVASSLGRALVEAPLSDLPPSIERLVIVADDALHRLPFDALILPDGRYLLERFATGFAPSATIATELWERSESTTGKRVLALGDPSFLDDPRDADVETAAFISAFRASGGLAALPGSGREAREVGRFGQASVVRVGADASEAWLKRSKLTEYGVVHLATHAVVDEAAVTRTALALAPGDGEDGFLGPSDLAALDLRADLVVLSACRTADGVLIRGEGIQGLTAPLLEAGARAIVATVWRIEDQASVELVRDFYRALASGMPAGDALRAAKLAALERGAPAREWAAFTLVGDPAVQVALVMPGPGRAPWLWATALLVVLLLLAGRRRGVRRATQGTARP